MKSWIKIKNPGDIITYFLMQLEGIIKKEKDKHQDPG